MKFAITARFSGVFGGYEPCNTTLGDVRRVLRDLGYDRRHYDVTDRGDSEYSYLAEGDPESWWANVQDLTFSDVVDRATFTRFVDDLGLYAEDVETMGTLGGPANPIGVAPDVSFTTESQCLVASVRVTPISDIEPPASASDEWMAHAWERIRRATISVYGI